MTPLCNFLLLYIAWFMVLQYTKMLHNLGFKDRECDKDTVWISAKGDICPIQFGKGELGLFKGSGLHLSQKEHTIAMLKVVWEIPECFAVDKVDFCIMSWYKRSCNVMRSSVTSFEEDIPHHVLLFPFNLVYFERTFYFSDLHRSRSWYYWPKIRHKAALSLV